MEYIIKEKRTNELFSQSNTSIVAERVIGRFS